MIKSKRSLDFDDPRFLLAGVFGLAAFSVGIVRTGNMQTAVIYGALTIVVTLALVLGYEYGQLSAAARYGKQAGFWLVDTLLALARNRDHEAKTPYSFVVGRNIETGRTEVEDITKLGHIGVWGMTRFGKTTWLHSLIHQLITTNRPNELRIAISDPKQVDYPFYGRLAHLFCPVARDATETMWMVDCLIGEMNARIQLFTKYKDKICNNLERYEQLSGSKLPRIVAIFDEMADVVEKGGELERKMIRLAKLGQAYGIYLVCATQRPSAGVMTGEIRSQLATIASTYMASSREYGAVGLLPKELYETMQPIPGQFMIYTPTRQWRIVQGLRFSNKQLIAAVKQYQGRERTWPLHLTGGKTAEANEDLPARRPSVQEPPMWSGSQAEKDEQALRWLMQLGKRPTNKEFASRFGISERTASKHLGRLWKTVERHRVEAG